MTVGDDRDNCVTILINNDIKAYCSLLFPAGCDDAMYNPLTQNGDKKPN
jgi:hypothetical protein